MTEVYGLFSDPDVYTEVNETPGPSDIVDVPAWVVTFNDLCLPSHGLIQPSFPPTGCTSDWNVVVNADTGEFVEAFNS